MSLGAFCLILATLFIGGHTQNAANVAQVPKTYSLSPFLDPLGLTRPRPALFSLTSVPLGRLPLFGFGATQGLYPMGQGVYPNSQVPGANAGANAGAQLPGANAGANAGAQLPGANAGANAGAQLPGANAGANAGAQLPGANAGANGGAQLPGANAGANGGAQLPGANAAAQLPGANVGVNAAVTPSPANN